MLFRKYSKIGSRPKFTRPPIQESGSSENDRRVLRHAQQPCASRCSAALRIQMLSSPARPRIPERQSKGSRIVKGWSSRNKRRVLRHAQQPCASRCSAALRVQMHSSPAHPRIPERSRRVRLYKNCPSNSWGESQGRYRHLKSKAFAHCKIPSKNYKIPSF